MSSCTTRTHRGRATWLSTGAGSALLLLLLGVGRPAEAIPAFARSHNFSCTTCHQPFPRLKPYGEEFAGNAFAPSDAEGMPPRYFLDVGDDALALLRDLPLGVRADLYADVQAGRDDRDDGFTDLKVPYGIKLLSGGRIAKNVGYYFYFYMSERGEVAGLEDAYLHFHQPFDLPVDLLIGQFQVSDPLFKRELRLTFQDYLLYKVRPGRSLTNLTYDRGLLLTTSLPTGTDLTAILVNGNGLGEADAREDYDFARGKLAMGRISQDLGPLRLGFFVFGGTEEQAPERGVSLQTNAPLLWGPDLTLAVERFELNVQYLRRHDDNPWFLPVRGETPREGITTDGLLGELLVDLTGNGGPVWLVVLANWVDSDEDRHDVQAYTGSLTWLWRSNLRLLAEYTYTRDRGGVQVDEHRGTLGLVSGF
ncbi:MAG: hypothetical protein RBU45_07995 [Myxococcota bacterium]|jgi:hypothetical protein|nr:hypothetical protein [Myxococcota bacterium]